MLNEHTLNTLRYSIDTAADEMASQIDDTTIGAGDIADRIEAALLTACHIEVLSDMPGIVAGNFMINIGSRIARFADRAAGAGTHQDISATPDMVLNSIQADVYLFASGKAVIKSA